MSIDEGGIRHQEVLDDVDIEGIADGPGLVEVEEVAKKFIFRKS